MFMVFHRKPILLSCVAAVCVIALAASIFALAGRQDAAPAFSAEEPQEVILDAGHGGFDGGAVSPEGIMEKDLNLVIAKETQIALLKKGFCVIMTREDDAALESAKQNGVSKKVSDIHRRVEIMKEHPNAIFVSIHMNKFAESQYSGAQVFYATVQPGSEELAESIQSTIIEKLQPENTRVIKPAPKNVYILEHAAVPTVIVECGFLSNVEETKKLSDPDYQTDMANCIAEGIIKYMESETGDGKE